MSSGSVNRSNGEKRRKEKEKEYDLAVVRLVVLGDSDAILVTAVHIATVCKCTLSGQTAGSNYRQKHS